MRKVIRPDGLPMPYPEFSPAVAFDRWVFAAGQLASDFRGGLAPDVRGNPRVPFAGEDERIRESRYIFESLARTLAVAGADLGAGVRIDQYPVGAAIMDPYHVVRREVLAAPRPASTSVPVSGLLVPEARIAMEFIAIQPQAGFEKQSVKVEEIPQTIFGIVPAIRVGDFVFVAAQVATDFKTGVAPEARRNPNFWEGNEVDLQTRYILNNFFLTLRAAGSSFANVVKAQVYLTDMADLPRFAWVWREFFPSDPPALTILPANGLGVAGTCIEINLVALADGGRTRKEVIATPEVPRPLFHCSQAIRAGNLLFISGLLAVDENGLVPAARINPHHPYVTCTATAQAESIMTQAEAICHAAGTEIGQAVRLLDIQTDLGQWAAAARARRAWFAAGEPATTSIAVPGPLPVPGCTLMADFWIAVPE